MGIITDILKDIHLSTVLKEKIATYEKEVSDLTSENLVLKSEIEKLKTDNLKLKEKIQILEKFISVHDIPSLIVFDLFSKLPGNMELSNLIEDLQAQASQISKAASIYGGVWLLDLNNELALFRLLLDWADSHTISYKISYFEKKPEFT
jgi:FtsZ-binding cell division protein ZapB